MSLSRSQSLASAGPPAPNYIPATPSQFAPASARLEKGFVREAVKPRGNPRELKRLTRIRETREIMEDLIRNDGVSQDFHLDLSNEQPADAFCFLLIPSEQATLLDRTGASEAQLQAFQNLLSGKAYVLEDALAFATLVHQLTKPLEKAIHDLPGFKLVQQRADALVTAGSRIRFVHSMVNTATHNLNAACDLGEIVKPGRQGDSGSKPAVVGVLNPASRSGWGRSGASKAIQDGAKGTGFQSRQRALYQRRTNAVANAPVGQAYVVPVSEDKVVFSVAGPNHKHHTALRMKVPRLSHLLKPNHVSPSQERKLRTAYRSFFASVDQYNADAGLTGKDAIKQLHMVPISANVFGFPKDKAARIMAEETLRYAAQNPDIQVQVLAANDPALAGHIEADFEQFGATSVTDNGVPKHA